MEFVDLDIADSLFRKNRVSVKRGLLQLQIEEFMRVVDSYIHWYNEKRIKISLGSLSPLECRESLGFAA